LRIIFHWGNYKFATALDWAPGLNPGARRLLFILQSFRIGQGRKALKTIEVVKMRDTKTDGDARSFEIGKGGIRLIK
jgi:hypothetical protein